MQTDSRHDRGSLERGVVILSIDTEQRWGYLDLLDGPRFDSRYPDALGAHDRLLAALSAAGVSATWFVVGGMSLRGSRGARDRRMAGLPAAWVAHIPVGNETTMPLWYRQSFVERLRAASPHQEIGLHGGLTHFIWTDERATQDVVEWELVEGLKALRQVRVQPLSFSFGREREAHHELLLRHGIRSYRGRTTSLAHRLGSTIPGAMLRAINELTLGDTVAGVAARDAAGAVEHSGVALSLSDRAGQVPHHPPALARRAVQPRRGRGGPLSRHIPLLPAPRKSRRVPCGLFPVRRHAGAPAPCPRPGRCRRPDHERSCRTNRAEPGDLRRRRPAGGVNRARPCLERKTDHDSQKQIAHP